MGFARIYRLRAAEGCETELSAALSQLEAALPAIPGFCDTLRLRLNGDPQAVVFIERWASEADHKASGPQIPTGIFKDLMASLESKPVFEDATWDSGDR